MKFLILGSFLLAFHFHIYFIHCDNYYFNNITYGDTRQIPDDCKYQYSCGDIINITYPFRLKWDPKGYCSERKYKLLCINNQTVLHLKEGNFAVKAINYTNSIIRVSDLRFQQGNYCSSIPQHSRSLHRSNNDYSPYSITNSSNIETIAYLSCEKPVNSPFYVNTSDCIREKEAFGRRYSYVVVDKSLDLSDLATSCAVDLVTTTTMLRDTNKKNFTYVDIHKELVYGFELSFRDIQCDCGGDESYRGICRVYDNNTVTYDCSVMNSIDILPYTCNHHSSCGEIVNITYPFRLKGDPKNCGEPKYELSCIDNQTILSRLNYEKVDYQKVENFAVKYINYMNSIIRVSDLGVEESNYSSIPRYSWGADMLFHTGEPYAPYIVQREYQTRNSKYSKRLAYVSCKKPLNSSSYLKLNTSDCIIALGRRGYCYVVVDQLDLWELATDDAEVFHRNAFAPPMCVVDFVTTATLLRDSKKNFTYVDIHKDLVYGFELGFNRVQCKACIGINLDKQCYCRFDNNSIYRTYLGGHAGYCE